VFPPRLHLITDDEVLADPAFLQNAARVIDSCGSAIALHLRGHHTDSAVLYSLAERLAALCAEVDALLVVNDRVDIALGVGATAVQLGMRSLPIADTRDLVGVGCRIGVSAHDAAEAAFAAADGADWIIMGTIYDSASHPDVVPAGLDALRDCVEGVTVPVIAIGGITTDRIAQVKATGAHGAAVLGGVWHAEHPAAAALRYRDAVRARWDATGELA
jgi:thiazole tautomerase (transcriptional regulator TenI)